MPCPSGSISNMSAESCRLCPGGTYSENGTTCVGCPQGTFSTDGASICAVCPAGKFSSNVSASACSDCPPGKWNNQVRQKDASSCLECSTLPGVRCPGASAVPLVGSGLFRLLDAPNDIFVCLPREACQAAEAGNTSCGASYQGTMCSTCRIGYFREGGRCVKCMARELRWTIVVMTMILFLVVSVKVSEDQSIVPHSLRLTLFWIQFLSLFPALVNTWPPVLLNLLNFASFFNLDLGYLGVNCDFHSSYYSVLRFKITLPFLFLAFLVLYRVILFRMKKISRLSWIRIVSQFLFTVNFFSIQLFSSLFQVFNCTQALRGSFVLVQEPSLPCFDGQWMSFVVFDIVFIVFYMLLIPTFIGFLGWKLRTSGEQQTWDLFMSPLVQHYRKDARWFECVRVLFRLFFVLIRDTARMENSSKITFLGFIVVANMWLECRTRPYAEQTQNDLSTL
eukprot:TRINITY_DN11951_c0_g1_i3.p1 TRINITY_DN11951_c0_g1~~TRINITY_DN11951_c0_g1_i3.p1  ORF type:complete len:450 (-),score=82.23 TRINITY_DN11951_c0_g1_i3:348-1697(-)